MTLSQLLKRVPDTEWIQVYRKHEILFTGYRCDFNKCKSSAIDWVRTKVILVQSSFHNNTPDLHIEIE